MKRIKEIQNVLNNNRSTLDSKFKVKKIGIFGSLVRGEDREQSDIDILVELYEPIGWDFVELKDFLEKILQKPVDLVTKNSLKPLIRDQILSEVIYT